MAFKLDAFKMFVHRRTKDGQISAFIGEQHGNFIRALYQIIQPKVAIDRKAAQKVREKVLAMGALSEREWILEKLGS